MRKAICLKKHREVDEKSCENCSVYLEWFRGSRETPFECMWKKQLNVKVGVP